MASWQEIVKEAPDLATRVQARFGAGTNKTIATLRRDGSPRISASELEFTDTDITLGMMGGSMKLLDVRRDPRIAIHSPTLEPPADDPGGWPGDAKLAGTAVEMPAPPDTPHVGAGFFRIDVTEVVLTYLGTPADHLVIESWHEGMGYRRRTRT
jgi:hypothetical protein